MSTTPGKGGRVARALFSLTIMFGALGAALYIPPQLGLDLSGGTQIVLETHDSDAGVEANAENTDNAVEVLRNRIDTLGVSEATMSRSGENRIIVELPGVQDPTEAAEILGTTAQLTFHPVLGVEAPDGQAMMPENGELGELPEGLEDGEDEGGQNEGDEARPPASAEGEDPPEGDEEPADELGEEELEELLQLQEDQEGEMPVAPEPADPEDVDRTLPDEQGQQLQLGAAAMEGDLVSSAEAALDEYQTSWMVNVSFQGEGRDIWADLTGEAACHSTGDPRRQVAIVLDEQIISSPQVNPDIACDVGITGGNTSITGNFTQESAEELAVLIEGGALPLPVEEIERRTVGPTLGADAIDASWKAGLIGLVLTFIYICVAYRLVGFLASLALVAYTLIAYAALVVLGATLTLPGLAGFVLAIGMAIDANVLIFERTREEYQHQKQTYDANKSAGMADATEEEAAEQASGPAPTRRRRRAIPPNLHRAFLNGTQKAWSAIVDTNITTMMAAILLIFLASGPVQGFGWTLSIGTVASLISALVIARVLVEWALRRKVVRHRAEITGITRYSQVRQWLVDRQPDIMGRGRLWLGITGVVVAVCIAAIAFMPKNFGVEFTGGRVMDFTVSEDMEVEEARSLVAEAGYPQAVVQESGDGDIAVRSGPLEDAEAHEIEQALATEGGEVDRVSDEFIGPSLGNQLRNQALLALGIALAFQMAYLAWRFRWSFGLSTMAALAFDILLVVGLFTMLGRPIDGVFLAAVLSVIGFSVNDSVVVFDRVRDEWSRDDQNTFSKIANTAILHTIPRTVNTTISALFILAILALFGGASLTDFAVAMLVGLTSGVFSTIFLAVPLASLLQRWDKTPAPHVIKARKAKQRKEMERVRDEDDGAVV